MTTLYDYRFYCVTEGIYVDVWAPSVPVPLLCPHNSADTINSATLFVAATVSDDRTIVQDGTQGYYTGTTIVLNIPSGTPGFVYTYDQIYPYDILIWTSNFTSTSAHVGDSLDIIVGPNSTLGTTTATGNIGATTLNCSSTVFTSGYMSRGISVAITDGVNSQDLGRVTAIDTVNNIITFENALTTVYNSGSFVQINIHLINNQFIGVADKTFVYGRKGIATRKVPAGTIIRFYYTNSNGTAKTLYFDVEYNYL
jgi:hypothetical protein